MPQDTLAGTPQEALPDPARYDTTWGSGEIPERLPEGIEAVMLSEDRLYVVLAVVLLIWLGVLFFVYRTDRKIGELEREVDVALEERDEAVH